MTQLVTLEQWAAGLFGEAAPCAQTLRRWARNGCLYPAARKIGRAYFVDPATQYLDPLAPPVDNVSTSGVRLSSGLSQRIFGVQTASRR